MKLFGTTATSLIGIRVSKKLSFPLFYRPDQPQEVAPYEYTPAYKLTIEYIAPKSMLFTLKMYKIPRNMNKMSFLDIINKRVSESIFQCNFLNNSEREVFLGVAYLSFKNKTQKGYEGTRREI